MWKVKDLIEDKDLERARGRILREGSGLPDRERFTARGVLAERTDGDAGLCGT